MNMLYLLLLHNIFNISFKSDEKQNIRLRILNLIGEKIFEEDYIEYIGEYTRQFNLNKFGKGVYFLAYATAQGGNTPYTFTWSSNNQVGDTINTICF